MAAAVESHFVFKVISPKSLSNLASRELTIAPVYHFFQILPSRTEIVSKHHRMKVFANAKGMLATHILLLSSCESNVSEKKVNNRLQNK